MSHINNGITTSAQTHQQPLTLSIAGAANSDNSTVAVTRPSWVRREHPQLHQQQTLNQANLPLGEADSLNSAQLASHQAAVIGQRKQRKPRSPNKTSTKAKPRRKTTTAKNSRAKTVPKKRTPAKKRTPVTKRKGTTSKRVALASKTSRKKNKPAAKTVRRANQNKKKPQQQRR
jgi:hypothetical protein